MHEDEEQDNLVIEKLKLNNEVEVTLDFINRTNSGFPITENMTLEEIYLNCFSVRSYMIEQTMNLALQLTKKNKSYDKLWETLKFYDNSFIKVIIRNGKYYATKYNIPFVAGKLISEEERDIFITKLIQRTNNMKIN